MADGALVDSGEGAKGSGSDCDSSEGHWEVVVGWGQPDAGAGQTSLEEWRAAQEEWRAAQEDLPQGSEATEAESAPAHDAPRMADRALEDSGEGSGFDSDSSEGQTLEEWWAAQEDLTRGNEASAETAVPRYGSLQRDKLEKMVMNNMKRSQVWNLPCFTNTEMREDALVQAGLFLEARIVDYYHGSTADTRKKVIDWLSRMGAAVVVDTSAEQERLPCPSPLTNGISGQNIGCRQNNGSEYRMATEYRDRISDGDRILGQNLK